MNGVTGSAVAVFGGAGAMGQAIADAFAEAGARVVVADAPDALAALETGTDGRVRPTGIPVDLSAPSAPEDTVDRVIEALGRLDVLVMAARPVGSVKALDMSRDMLKRVVEDELIFPGLLMVAAARRMVGQGSGRIISLVSMSAKTGVHTGTAPFAAAKGGLLTLSRVMAAELADTGVTVNVIATALFEPQVSHMDPEERAKLLLGIPVRRFGKPEEAAHAALYLASPQAGYVTGETMNLSGGRFMD